MGSKNDSSITSEVDDRLENFFGDESEEGQDMSDSSTEAEVSDRLDDLFGDSDDEVAAPAPVESEAREATPAAVEEPRKPVPAQSDVSTVNTGSSPIKDLKSVVLSLEWEITDEVMQRLGEEITKLEEVCKDDKIVVAFLQLLGSLGKYIQKKRAEAHPDSIGLLNSVYESLEKVMLSEGLTEAAKKKMLIGQVNKYKMLKELIATTKTAPVRRTGRKVPETVMVDDTAEVSVVDVPEETTGEVSLRDEAVAAPSANLVSSREIVTALQEINKTIQAGFEALREDLKSFMEK